jgi:hypothetical protein
MRTNGGCRCERGAKDAIATLLAEVERLRILAIFYRDLCIDYVSSQTLEREAAKSGITLGEL